MQENNSNINPNNIVLFSKQAGKTSFSSLFTIKKAFSTTKVGHTGTLDSFAEGLLVVCVGNLTRLAGKITEFDKSYKAVLLFGEETDTLECTGSVIKTSPCPTEEALRASVQKFTSTYMQKPPLFSAIHIDGKRASDVARKTSGKNAAGNTSGQAAGKTGLLETEKNASGAACQPPLEIPSRSVTVFSSEVEELMLDSEGLVRAALINFHVSKGTYIRSLARDIAEDCGSACHLIALRRTQVGNFALENAAGFSLLKPFSIQYGFENAELMKKLEEEEKLRASEREGNQEKKRQPYIPSAQELLLQEEVRQKCRKMSPEIAQECGFDLLTLKKESEDWFSHGGKLSSKMFTVSPFTLEKNVAAVFSENLEFKGLLQKDENGYFKYSLVIN